MYEGTVRFAFGPRPLADVDEEAASSLLDQQERELERDTPITDIMALSPPPPPVDDYSETRDPPNPDKIWDPDDELIAQPRLELASHNLSPLPKFANFYTDRSMSTSSDTADSGIGANGADVQQAEPSSEPPNVASDVHAQVVNVDVGLRRRLFPQPEYGEAFLDLLPDEHQVMDAMFRPVRRSLLRLRATMPESLPDYHAQTSTRSHAQILRARFSEAAAQIQRILRQYPEHERGTLELRLCRLIATDYWPLPLISTTHLDIQRIYRNALFRHTTREQLQADEARNQEWAALNQDMQLQRGSFRDAPISGDLVNNMTAANVAQLTYYEQELEQERKRRLAAEEQDLEAYTQDDTTKREKQIALDFELARQWQYQESRQVDIPNDAASEQLTHAEQNEEARRRTSRIGGLRFRLNERGQIEEDRSQERSPPRTRRHIRSKPIRRPVRHLSKIKEDVAFNLEMERVRNSSPPPVDIDLDADRERYLKHRKRKNKDEDVDEDMDEDMDGDKDEDKCEDMDADKE